MIYPHGMTEKVKGEILRTKESPWSDVTFLFVKYIDPRDGTWYTAWFNDQTDEMVYAREMHNHGC